MKSEIKYNASREIKQLIAQWQSWLLNERRYSPHTLDAYSRDLSGFFDFAAEHLGKVPETADLAKLEVRDFRAYLSQRAARHIDKSSLARELSTLKNFFKWLARYDILRNPALSVIRTPRRAKVLPKALEVNDTFNVIDEAQNLASNSWQGLRDTAIFTLLYGCGLRISEALSLNLGDIGNNDFLRIKGKGNKERIVPLLPVVVENINTDTRKAVSNSLFFSSPIMATTASEVNFPACASFLIRFACETEGAFWVSSIAFIISCCCSAER